VTELCPLLDQHCLGTRRLDLLFHRVDSQIEAIRIGTAKPARDAKRLTKLLVDRLDTVDPGLGIELMTIQPSDGTGPLINAAWLMP
jgi:protein ImuB